MIRIIKKFTYKSFLLGFILFLINISMQTRLLADSDILKDIRPSEDREYIIRLSNGDIITGAIVEQLNDATEGEGIKYRTEIGTGIVYAKEILELTPKENFYRHNHRVFLLPTAEPVENNYFVGDFELLFLYAGGGIGDFLSFTVGRSIVPGIASSQQLSVADVKVTLFQTVFDSIVRKISFAVGGNLGFVNNANRLTHLYAVSTVLFNKTRITASVFYKNFGQDYYTLNFAQYTQPLIYADGAFGIGLGLDSKISTRHDLHVIGELWNSDITRPSNTAVLLGLRLCNRLISMDFGLSFFTAGYVAPFTSFVLTPF